MKRIVWNDAWTGHDKTQHVVACAAGALIVGLTFGLTAAAIAVTAVALGKELVYDAYLEKGDPTFQDFVASMVGGAFGMFSAHILLAAGPAT